MTENESPAPVLTISFTLMGPALEAWRRVAPTIDMLPKAPGEAMRPATDDDVSLVAYDVIRVWLKQKDPNNQW